MIKKKVVNGLHYAKSKDGSILKMTRAEALKLGTETIRKLTNEIPWASAYSPFIKEHHDYFEISYKIR